MGNFVDCRANPSDVSNQKKLLFEGGLQHFASKIRFFVNGDIDRQCEPIIK